jgi:hypothetical protein
MFAIISRTLTRPARHCFALQGLGYFVPTKNLVKKLQKKYNKEDIVVIKRVNEALVVTEGNMKNIKGEYVII